MNAIERMIAAGLSRENAADNAMWFMSRSDEEGLERFVLEVEHNAIRTKERKQAGA